MNKSALLLPLLLGALLMVCSSATHANVSATPISSLAVAIDKAGRQRMLTQRIIKAYAQELLDIDPIKSQQQREAAISLFDQQLTELKQFAPNEKVRDAFATVDALWRPFRERAKAKANRSGLESLAASSDELLATSHRAVVLLEEISSNNLGHLVNISGRQRMLSQRIAKLYMLRSLGIDNATIRQELDKASNEFRTALSELDTAHENNAEIRTALTSVKRNWSVFEASFRLTNGNFTPFMIATYSERVLTGMNDITAMYAALPISSANN